MFEYTMEELLPVLALRTRKYTSNDSSSVPYDVARQLLGSILYCIEGSADSEDGELQFLNQQKPDPLELFKIGLEKKKKKIEKAKALYQKIEKEFYPVDNEFYRSTLLEGMPAFFKTYDVEYHAQDTILTLDYPLHDPIEGLSGIDMIYEYLVRFDKEQQILRRYAREVVEEVLINYHKGYKGLVINICGIVMEHKEECELLEQNRDQLRVLQALREEEIEEVFRDGQMMEDEKLREIIAELMDCSQLSDKLAIIKESVHSLADLKEILNECIYPEEYDAVIGLLTEEEKKFLNHREDME